jgi:hypothetical protein
VVKAYASGGDLIIHHLASGEMQVLRGQYVMDDRYTRLTPDDRTLIASSAAGHIDLIELASARVLTTLADQGPGLLSPSGDHLLSIGRDGRVRRFEVPSGRCDATYDVAELASLEGAWATPAGPGVIARTRDGAVVAVSLAQGDVAPLYPAGVPIHAIAVEPAGAMALVATDASALHLWSLT